MCLALSATVFAQRRPTQPSPAVVNSVFRAAVRPWMSLDGDWDFALDPQDAGEQEHWFESGGPFSQKIHVPGAWEAEGIGDPGPSQSGANEHSSVILRHGYRGTAWYRKSFHLGTDWGDKRVWLKVGGVNSQGTFWLNGKIIGTLNVFCGTYKYDITPILKDGENTLVVRVSNKTSSRKGEINWIQQFGGLYRSVELEATSPIYIDDVWARPDLGHSGTVLQIQLMRFRQAQNRDSRISVQVSTLDGQAAGRAEQQISSIDVTGTTVMVPVTLDPFRPWSPEQPSLYKVTVDLQQGGKIIDAWIERFGVRELERRGSDIYLNGHRYLLRGFGDDYVYPLTIASPTSREEHKKHLELARAYGFNYARQHTHAENPEYFQAAEEVGILIQAELPYYGSQPSLGDYYGPVDDLTELVRHYRRYTSLATYSMGNEGLHLPELREPLFRLAKLLDPYKLVLHQDGNVNVGYGGGVDFEGIADFRGGYPRPPVKDEDIAGSMPVVLHEFLNLAGPPDPRLEPLYTGAEAASLHLQDEREAAEKAGVSWELALRAIDAGHELQSIHQKLGLENARARAALAGYDYWTIVDVNNTRSQGLLDMFWRPKRSTPAFFHEFNGPTVLLLPSLSYAGDDRVFVAGAKLSLPITCSNYGLEAMPSAKIVWSVTADGQVYSRGRLEQVNLPQGAVTPAGQIDFVLPMLTHPAVVALRAQIEDTEVANEWKFYSFPERSQPKELTNTSASKFVFDAISGAYAGLKLAPDRVGRDLLITEKLDESAFQTLSSGGSVLLVSLADFSPVQSGVRLGWWSPSDQRGTALATSAAFSGFPAPGGFLSLGLFRTFRDAAPLNGKLENHVDPLMITIGKNSYLTSVFQANVGSGKLFATGLYVLSEKPEARYLLDRFIEYVQSSQFEPRRALALDDLRTVRASTQ